MEALELYCEGLFKESAVWEGRVLKELSEWRLEELRM